jgi:hypothetical protein
MRVFFVDGAVEFDAKPICGYGEIREAIKRVNANVVKLAEALPAGHPWKEHKLLHMEQTAKEADEVEQMLGMGKVGGENLAFLKLMGGTHDIGRIVEGKKKLGLLPSDYREFANHGEESVNLLRDWGVSALFNGEAGAVLEYGILHHADKATQEEDAGSALGRTKYFFLAFLRDMDKLALFRNKTARYLWDDGEKTRQMAVNGLEGEMGRIEPREILSQFAQRQLIEHRLCRSYEAYMLQFLAWIFDLKLRLALEEVIKIGAVEQLLRYFEKQLPHQDSVLIRRTVNEYLSSLPQRG